MSIKPPPTSSPGFMLEEIHKLKLQNLQLRQQLLTGEQASLVKEMEDHYKISFADYIVDPMTGRCTPAVKES